MMLEDYFKEQKAGKAKNIRIKLEPGTKIQGTVIAIDKKSVFLDINSKSEGIINCEELTDKKGDLIVNVGDKVDAYFVSDKGGEIILTVKMSGKFVAGHLEDAYRSRIPVDGKVIEERKGGYLIKVSGKDAFCPYSQIDLFLKEPASYIGNSYSFIITEMNKFNTVLSRRKLLEKEKVKRIEYLRETLNEGDLITGTVISMKDFGVFVDLNGCEGFIPISELAWGRIENPSELLKADDRIKVAVKRLDWENNKITLSYRSAQTSWDEIADRYPIGKLLSGKVTRLTNFGAFVELEKGIEGLIHISRIDPGRKINHPRESLTVGDVVSIVIESIDKETQKISLARDFSGENSFSDQSKSVGQTEWKDFKRGKPESSQFGTSLADVFKELDFKS